MTKYIKLFMFSNAHVSNKFKIWKMIFLLKCIHFRFLLYLFENGILSWNSAKKKQNMRKKYEKNMLKRVHVYLLLKKMLNLYEEKNYWISLGNFCLHKKKKMIRNSVLECEAFHVNSSYIHSHNNQIFLLYSDNKNEKLELRKKKAHKRKWKAYIGAFMVKIRMEARKEDACYDFLFSWMNVIYV